jgi:hypothetical protein
MIKFKIIAFVLCICILFSTSSCLVLVHKDNGKRGWTKNSNNPHHPATTNPGKSRGNGKHK